MFRIIFQNAFTFVSIFLGSFTKRIEGETTRARR